RDARHAARRRDPGRAGAGDQAGHAAPNARRRDPPIPGLQPRARGEPGRARGEGRLSAKKAEVTMSRVETKLEIVTIPVSDVDRAKDFYEGLGWRLDADFSKGDWRVLQLTPPGSACSIFIGKGLTTAAPGSVQGLLLIVDDIQAARADLAAHGANPSEVFHFD